MVGTVAVDVSGSQCTKGPPHPSWYLKPPKAPPSILISETAILVSSFEQCLADTQSDCHNVKCCHKCAEASWVYKVCSQFLNEKRSPSPSWYLKIIVSSIELNLAHTQSGTIWNVFVGFHECAQAAWVCSSFLEGFEWKEAPAPIQASLTGRSFLPPCFVKVEMQRAVWKCERTG